MNYETKTIFKNVTKKPCKQVAKNICIDGYLINLIFNVKNGKLFK